MQEARPWLSKGGTMEIFQQSVTWWPLAKLSGTVEEKLRQVREIGYRGVEFAPEEHWPLVHSLGLTIATTSAHGTLTDGLNRRENHDRIEREILANIEKAVAWKIPCLICFSGNRGGLSDDEGAANTALGLARVAGAAERAGVTLVMELLNSRVDHPDYQADRTDWGVSVCENVGSPAVKLLYDIYHMQIMEGDLIRTIRRAAPWIGHYHTAGNPGRAELSADQEIHYPAVCRAIATTGFTGFIGQEFGPKGDPHAALVEAFRACDLT